MNAIDDRIGAIRVIPVVTIDHAGSAVGLCEALLDGGLPCVEITLRTPLALDALRACARLPGMLVGAGTVTRAQQVADVADAGAAFVVSPGLSAGVVEACAAAGIAHYPGVTTPTEVMRAVELGCDTVKLFPANLVGGPAAVRALSAPFPSVRFVPTGGVSPANLADYLALDAVLAVGGSWMVPADRLRAGDFEEIRRLASEASGVASEACDVR